MGDLGFSEFVIGACLVLYLLMLTVHPSGVEMRSLLGFLSPSGESLFVFGASGAAPVFRYGRWWTPLSATWLHAGVLHIAFNMMWVRQLAPPVSELYGAYRMVVIYTLSGVSGFILSSAAGWFLWFLPGFLKGADFTVGASAAIFGLLGALLYYGRRGGSRFIGQQARVWAVVMLVYGFVMPGIDNWAHLGGLGGGYLAGAWLDPMKPERTDHLLMAIACLLLSLAAIVVSVVGGLSWTR